MKAVWKGYLGFGLVNIPVSLYSAIEKNKFSFRLLHSKDKGPINYKRVCSKCDQEISWNDIVKGLEITKNEFYVLTKEELEELKPEGDDLIEIHEFVDKSEIDPIFINNHYFIGPIEGAERPYYLLKETLGSSNRIAIATFVMREKKYLSIIQNYNQGLLLSILNWSDEIRSIENIPYINQEKSKLKQRELDLAEELVDKLTSKSLNLSKYKDTFTENLKKAIKLKAKGEFVSIQKEKRKETENLIDTLRASIEK
ncbi:MAG: Ku protein [Candidatus Lokiarchaeota archaeon]